MSLPSFVGVELRFKSSAAEYSTIEFIESYALNSTQALPN